MSSEVPQDATIQMLHPEVRCLLVGRQVVRAVLSTLRCPHRQGVLRPACGGRRAVRSSIGREPPILQCLPAAVASGSIGGRVFLYCGKLIPEKRPSHSSVRAIARASKAAPHVQGLIVGDGPMRKECETLVRELGAPVQFAGFLNQSQLIDAYIAADSLVLPSLRAAKHGVWL